VPHISFSALKKWNECPYAYKIEYVDGIRSFKGNAYTAFGTALHSVCEAVLQGDEADPSSSFEMAFLQELQSLPPEVRAELDSKMVTAMRSQGKELAPLAVPALREYFGGEFELVSVEEEIMEPISFFTDAEYNFKGFIDVVVKTPDGKYHVVDWKTCSWGWDARRRNEKMVTYQLAYYKHFFSLKHGIEPEKVDTHFALLKRTAKKNRVEIFQVPCGNVKVKNALKLASTALWNINEQKFIKNRLSCSRCAFHHTSQCP
jgi:RecB family exonuclease